MPSGTVNIRWSDTIAAMRAFNIGNAQHYTAIVHGYASPGDGGGGVFHWSADQDVEDGGTIGGCSSRCSTRWGRTSGAGSVASVFARISAREWAYAVARDAVEHVVESEIHIKLWTCMAQ